MPSYFLIRAILPLIVTQLLSIVPCSPQKPLSHDRNLGNHHALALDRSATDAQPEQTGTGFYYPLGRRTFDSACGKWLARDGHHGGCYFDGLYHIGVDMLAAEGDEVYAIADGKIFVTPQADGFGNQIVYVKHALKDGSEFLALYAHLRTGVKAGQSVTGGRPFATVGRFMLTPKKHGRDHLHFSVRPELRIAPTSYFEGFGSVRVGMTTLEASRAFGKPLTVVDTNEDCSYVKSKSGPEGISFMVIKGRVVRVDITAAGFTTERGARIGDSEARIKLLYKGQVTVTPHQYVERGHYLTVSPGGTNYRIVFETDGRRVTSFRAGRLPEVKYVEGCS